jgi:hypothetical protein
MARIALLAAAVIRHLRLSLTPVWLGLMGLGWGATSLDIGPGEAVFLVGGPLGGLTVWLRSSGDDGPRHELATGDDGDPPEWDWDRFERDLADYEARLPKNSPRSVLSAFAVAGAVGTGLRRSSC